MFIWTVECFYKHFEKKRQNFNKTFRPWQEYFNQFYVTWDTRIIRMCSWLWMNWCNWFFIMFNCWVMHPALNIPTLHIKYLNNCTCYNKIICSILFSSRWWVCWYELFSVSKGIRRFSPILGNFEKYEILISLECAIDSEWNGVINFIVSCSVVELFIHKKSNLQPPNIEVGKGTKIKREAIYWVRKLTTWSEEYN